MHHKTWAPAGILPGVGKLGVWDESPPEGSRDGAADCGGGLGAKPPEADDRL